MTPSVPVTLGLILFGSIVAMVYWAQRKSIKWLSEGRVLHERDLEELADRTGQIFRRPEVRLDFSKASNRDFARGLRSRAIGIQETDKTGLVEMLQEAASRIDGDKSALGQNLRDIWSFELVKARGIDPKAAVTMVDNLMAELGKKP